MKSNYKRYTVAGVGGINCRCCVSYGAKPTYKKQAKRRFNESIQQLILKEIADGDKPTKSMGRNTIASD